MPQPSGTSHLQGADSLTRLESLEDPVEVDKSQEKLLSNAGSDVIDIVSNPKNGSDDSIRSPGGSRPRRASSAGPKSYKEESDGETASKGSKKKTSKKKRTEPEPPRINLEAGTIHTGGGHAKPSFWDGDLSSFRSAYHEFKGIEEFSNKPIPGGFQAYFELKIPSGRSLVQNISGSGGKIYRTVRRAFLKAEEEAESKNVAVAKILEPLDEKLASTSGDFVAILDKYVGRKPPKVAVFLEMPKRKRKLAAGHSDSAAKKRRPGHVAKENDTRPADSKRGNPRERFRQAKQQSDRTTEENKQKDSKKPSYDGPLLLLEKDPDADGPYVEETAFLYHDPPMVKQEYEEHVPAADLRPLPKPLPPPEIPEALSKHWTYDPQSRVLLGNFSNGRQVSDQDKEYIRAMMQRDDITVVSEGLFPRARMDKFSPHFILKDTMDQFYHKFRQFKRVEVDGLVTYHELDGYLSMRVSKFFAYQELRWRLQNGGTEDSRFTYEDDEGKCHVIDVSDNIIYMVDVEMSTYTPHLDCHFKKYFELEEALPGGEWCMMNSMVQSARPFMGPNLYLSTPGGFTHLHQDGHGTVDSGHLVIAGYNEVIMLRRLPERHKQHAMRDMGNYDAIYKLPHGDSCDGHQGERPAWPSKSDVQRWQDMNYCPSVFILRPGQHVHINKGRIHAFRKVTLDSLREADCHFDLRAELLKSEDLKGASPNCISVAWDWMFTGSDAAGINREVTCTMESASLCRQNNVETLAVPHFSLLCLASRLAVERKDWLPFLGTPTEEQAEGKPSSDDLCRGILPSLRHIIHSEKERTNGEDFKRSSKRMADMDYNSNKTTVDPRGNDYNCKTCGSELANLYFHCMGCENHLSMDFNICALCHEEKHFKNTIFMNKIKQDRSALINHTGNMTMGRHGRRCPCKKGRSCEYCTLCTGCSCTCHQSFEVRFRTMLPSESLRVLDSIEKQVNEEVHYTKETELRLRLADNREGKAFEEKREYLSHFPRNQEQNENWKKIRAKEVSDDDSRSISPSAGIDVGKAEGDSSLRAAEENTTNESPEGEKSFDGGIRSEKTGSRRDDVSDRISVEGNVVAKESMFDVVTEGTDSDSGTREGEEAGKTVLSGHANDARVSGVQKNIDKVVVVDHSSRRPDVRNDAAKANEMEGLEDSVGIFDLEDRRRSPDK